MIQYCKLAARDCDFVRLGSRVEAEPKAACRHLCGVVGDQAGLSGMSWATI